MDIDNDDDPDYQPGFWGKGAWIWDLRGSGYTDWQNITFLTPGSYLTVIEQVIEISLPLQLVGGIPLPRIAVDSGILVVVDEQEKSINANPATAWQIVPAKSDQLVAPTATTAPLPTRTSPPATVTPIPTPETEPPGFCKGVLGIISLILLAGFLNRKKSP